MWLQLTVVFCLTFRWMYGVFSMTLQKLGLRTTRPAWCSVLLRLSWHWNLKIALFSANGHSKDTLVWEEANKKSVWEYVCRSLWMVGSPLGIFVHGSLFPPGRSRGQTDSYSAHLLPFLSVLCAASENAISMQLHYQCPPPPLIIGLQQPQGPPNFIALFLFLFCWWCLGQEP